MSDRDPRDVPEESGVTSALVELPREQLIEYEQIARLCPPSDEWQATADDADQAEAVEIFVDQVNVIRNLREVEAKRRIVDPHAGKHECISAPDHIRSATA